MRVDVPVGDPDFGKAVVCRCRLEEEAEGRLERLQRISNLGPLSRLTFDGFLPSGRPGKSTDTMAQDRIRGALALARRFAEDPQGWLVLMGASGCGKTHLAAAVSNHCMSMGRQVFFITAPDLLDHLRLTYHPQSEVSFDELFEHVRNVPLLVLDDLGAQSATPWAQEKLIQLLNHRYISRLPTVITTSTPLKEMQDHLRMRLTDPSLSQVCLIEEPEAEFLGRLGNLGQGLLSKMTFDAFVLKRLELDQERRKNLEKAYHLARGFAEEPEGWRVFLGEPGCGKTHLAAAIANYRRAHGQPALFVVVPDLLDYLRSTFSPDSSISYDDLFERVKSAPLLVLDDLGAQSSKPWAEEKLYQLINYRYNLELPTVVTSNHDLDSIERRLRSRIMDQRLSTVYFITAPSYRADEKPSERARPPSASEGRQGRRPGARGQSSQ
ncbi:MAG: ATP-binding protein [Dehalococcoidia bacterium]|nr:ATP-binding protein [Dehalococcoidia bacterium]